MRKFIIFLILIFPTITFGQNYSGNYRALFFNLFSEPKTIIVEFEVKADNSLNGKIKLDATVKDFSGMIDKKGKFEVVIEQTVNFTYKLKGKFDKQNKISLVQRNQIGGGLNKSVSESAIEGTFAKFVKSVENVAVTNPPSKVEWIDNGKSWLKIEHSNPFFGTEWTDFTASVGFGISTKTPVGSESVKTNESDYFILGFKSKIEGQQSLRINVRNYKSTNSFWKQNDLQTVSYREVNGEDRNSFLAGATLQTDSNYADGKIEIIKETDTQITFKIVNFKIRRIGGGTEFVVLNGFIYADKAK
jgi:hypothetical protein